MELSGSFFTLVSSERTEGQLLYRILINPEHWVFKCHFPERHIVPGVCLTQIMAELLSNEIGKPLFVREMKKVKFIGPVYPDQTPELLYAVKSITDDGSVVSVSATISNAHLLSDLLVRMSLVLVPNRF